MKALDFPNLASARATLSDYAYQVIRDAIVSLRLKPGQLVYEAELGKMMGVSRTPVREAFRRLMAEELIEVLPQRGARIAYISLKKIYEARIVRVSLETCAFKQVAEMWNPEEERFQKLQADVKKILQEQKDAVEAEDVDTFFQKDESFHLQILEAAGNSTLISIIQQMRGHLNRMRYLELLEAKHFRRLAEEHEAIFDAVTAKDAALAEQLLSRHIRWMEDQTENLSRKYPQYFKD